MGRQTTVLRAQVTFAAIIASDQVILSVIAISVLSAGIVIRMDSLRGNVNPGQSRYLFPKIISLLPSFDLDHNVMSLAGSR